MYGFASLVARDVNPLRTRLVKLQYNALALLGSPTPHLGFRFCLKDRSKCDATRHQLMRSGWGTRVAKSLQICGHVTIQGTSL